MTVSTDPSRRSITEAAPPITHLRARLHTSVFFERPSLVAFIGILAARFRAADLAFVTTTLPAIDTAERIIKANLADGSLAATIEEDFRLIFQIFEGPRLLQVQPIGYMGTGDLTFNTLSTGEGIGDRDAIETAISLRDKFIVSSWVPTLMPAQEWLLSHNIRLLTIRDLAYELRELSGDVYRAVVNEHRRGMDCSLVAHNVWMKSYKLPFAPSERGA